MSCLRHITSRLRTVLRSSNGLLHPRPCYLLDPSRHCASSPNTDHILVDDKRGDLVYVGTAARLVKGVKIFSLTSSGLCLGLQGVGLKLGVLTKVSAAVKWTMLGSISTLMVATPFLLHIIAGRYVTELYYNKETDTFTATTYSILVRKIETQWVSTAEDVEPRPVSMLDNIKVGKRPLLVDPQNFIDPQAYVRMMRFDKPPDWTYEDEMRAMLEEEERQREEEKREVEIEEQKLRKRKAQARQ